MFLERQRGAMVARLTSDPLVALKLNSIKKH